MASFALGRAISRSFSSLRPACSPRRYSSLPSSLLVASRVSCPKPLRAKALSVVSGRLTYSSSAKTALVTPDDKIKKADNNLVRVLESEIEDAEDVPTAKEIMLPKDCPFEVIDNAGDQSIVLKREFRGENIQVAVYMNYEDEEEGDEDDSEDESTNEALPSNISLVVTIKKGADPALEFCCNLYDSDDLEIESISLKKSENAEGEGFYEGPDFSDLDESLQKALRKYLAARGIGKSLFEPLREYMVTKDDREYLVWLKNLKQFVEM